MTFGPFKKVKQTAQSVIDPRQATQNKSKRVRPSQSQQDEKDAVRRADALADGDSLRVHDPTTHAEVEIRDADGEPEDAIKGENVLNIPLPEPDWEEYREVIIQLASRQLLFLSSVAIGSLLTLYLPLPHLLPFRVPALHPIFLLSLNALCAYANLHHFRNRARDEYQRRLWHAERQRGHQAGMDMDGDGSIGQSERMRESAEWANSLIAGVWPIMNTDLFAVVTDMLEDIMQSSSPAFVESVRITDLGLGTNPLRLTSVRALPDEPGDENAINELPERERERMDGAHVNMEVSFAYRARPTGKDLKSKVVNPHLVVDFFTGVKSVWSTPIPVWVELKGVVGTARVRMQLIPDPPFIKTTVVTLMGLPRVDISVVAVNKALPNMMNLPVISGFIQRSIETAAASYVAPKSLTLDLQQLISGDDMKKDTDAIGVLIIHIHRASGLSDDGAPPDSYVSVTFSKLGAPLFVTRVVRSERAPAFEETGAVLVHAGSVELRERVSVQVWDADRSSADDVLGLVEIDLLELMRVKGKPQRRRMDLQAVRDKHGEKHGHARGSIEFTIGFFGKRAPNERLRTDGADPGLPENKVLRAELAQAETRSTALNKLEGAVLHCPPDPDWPCGLVSIFVHGITHLVAGRRGRPEDSVQTAEEGEGLPSAYCTISLNDELVYKTRVKPLSSEPMFNAGTERFVRDWRTAHVTVTVKDARQRENDPILGLVVLKLSDLFTNASQVSRFYPVQEGVGTGRVRASILFRAVDARLPDNLRGFDSGTLKIHSVQSNTELVADCGVLLEGAKHPSASLSRKIGDTRESGVTTWEPEQPVVLPLRERYRAVLILTFRDTSGIRKQTKAIAALWLRDLIDSAPCTVDLALWEAQNDDDYDALRQNYLPPSGNTSGWASGQLRSLKRVGTARAALLFLPGLQDAHHSLFKQSADPEKKGNWDEVQRAQRGGLREGLGIQTGAAVQRRNAIREPGEGSPPTPTGSEPSGPTTNSSADTEASTRAMENVRRGATRSSVGSSLRAVENGDDGRAGLARDSTVRSSAARTDVTRGTNSTGSTADTLTSNRAIENARHAASQERIGSPLGQIQDGRRSTAPTAASGYTAVTDLSRRAVENARHQAGIGGPTSPSRPQSMAPTFMSGWTEETDSSRRAVENGSGGQSTAPTFGSGHTGSTDSSTRAVENGSITQGPYVMSPAMSSDALDSTQRPRLKSLEPVMSGDTVNSTDAVEDGDTVKARDYATDPHDGGSMPEHDGHWAEGTGTTYVDGAGGMDGHTDADDAASTGSESSGTEGGHRGLVQKVRDWKDQQRTLAHEHRGVMQAKPLRTAEWLKDNVQEGAHAVKARFKTKERQPSVETEA